jgi:hypothetical protein
VETTNNIETGVQAAPPAEALKKAQAWSNYALIAYNGEQKLMSMRTLTYNKPTTIEQIPTAEEDLKNLKATQASMTTFRLELISPMRKWGEKLIGFEKEMDTPIASLTNDIIALKQQKEKADADAVKRQQAQAGFRTLQLQEFSGAEVKASKIVNERIKLAYDYAIDNVTVEALPAYLQERKTKFTPDQFKIPPIKGNSPEEQVVIDEVWGKWNPERFVADYNSLLATQFANFAADKANVIEAKRKAAADEAARNEEASKNAGSAYMANQLENVAQASAPVSNIATKDLKKVYKLDATWTNYLQIMSAFVNNATAIVPLMKSKEPGNIKIQQIADALARFKGSNEAFNYQGLTFEQVEKL